MPKMLLNDQGIIDAYALLKSAPKVAVQFKISINTVHRRLNAHGIEKIGTEFYRANAKKCTDDQEKEIICQYNLGKSFNEICKDTGINLSALGSLLKRNGIKARKRGNSYKIVGDKEKGDVVNLYVNKKMNQSQISRALKIGQCRVGRILRKEGVIRKQAQSNHKFWKGGRTITSCGYVSILLEYNDPFYEMSNTGGYILEHRLVMARNLGRMLTRSETVHHINGIKNDNRFLNLQLHQGKHGKGVVYQCCDCGSHNVKEAKIIKMKIA